MIKSHPFSIYLLKDGFNPEKALRDDHKLQPSVASELPQDATLFILNAQPRPPWWKDYFGIKEELWQEYKGALIFLPVKEKYFALSFGQVFHHLNDAAYEYDFGLRVTLNSLDPKELKSADMVEPGVARRKRTQVPISTELTYLDFDGNSEIIKSLTGKVKKEYEKLFKNATGAAALKVTLKLEPNELVGVCDTLLTLYEKDDYKRTFPNIQNIVPIKDPTKISELDTRLLSSFQKKDGHITLAIPDIVDYRDNTCCVFSGNGRTSEVFPDISIEQFYEFLGDDFDLLSLTLDELKTYRMILTDADGVFGSPYNIYRALIFDAELAGDQVIYHLNDGSWYKVEKSYVGRLKSYLDLKCIDSDLCPYNHDAIKNNKPVYSEANYNAAVSTWSTRFICLDQTDISPTGNTEVEPCDLYTVLQDGTAYNGQRGIFYHLKISTRSSQLSHLFNQGVNSIELIELEEASREKLKQLLVNRLNGNNRDDYLSPFEKFDFKVIFGIITHKDKANKSSNLPLFSKISLMRNMQRLDLMKIPCALIFIEDQSPKKDSYSRYPEIIVQVCGGENGKVEVRPIAGQGFADGRVIKGCPKDVRDSPIGSKFKLTVKPSEDGSLSSFHSWPFAAVP